MQYLNKGKVMPKSAVENDELFAKLVALEKLSAKDAYKKLHPKCAERTAEVNGSITLRKTEVKTRIRELQDKEQAKIKAEHKKVFKARMVTDAEIINELIDIAFAKAKRYQPLEGGNYPTFGEKTTALKLLMEHRGLFEKEKEKDGDNGATLEELIERAHAAANRRNTP